MEQTAEAVEVFALTEYLALGSLELGIIVYFFLSFNYTFVCLNKIKPFAVGHQIPAS